MAFSEEVNRYSVSSTSMQRISNNSHRIFKMATIEVTSDFDMDMGEGKLPGTQTGTMIVDTTTGMPVTSDVSLNIKGSIKVQGMEIQMELVQKKKTTTKAIR